MVYSLHRHRRIDDGHGHATAGWGARIRTWEWRHQKPLPYHLATPQKRLQTRRNIAPPPVMCNDTDLMQLEKADTLIFLIRGVSLYLYVGVLISVWCCFAAAASGVLYYCFQRPRPV